MRLREIIQESKSLEVTARLPDLSQCTTYDEAVAALAGIGFSRVGSGSYSVVMARTEDDFVVKVGRGGDGYPAFVDWLVHQPPNPHLPRVGKLQWFGNAPASCYLVVIEKLREPPHNSVYNALYSALQTTVSKARFYNRFNPATFLRNIERSGVAEMIPDAKGVALTFATICNDFRLSHLIDTYSLNMMLREDGTIVLIDPICMPRHEAHGDKLG